MTKQEKYFEFTVQLDGGKIIEKMPTARKFVMIYDHEAERMNNLVRQTRTFYEKAIVEEMKPKEVVAEVSQETTRLEALRQQAKELGVKGAHVMKEETLIEKINEKQ